ncbi:MAG TPA: tyrosinase family protein, partial [Chitinophagaceae bacterium]|nr:tyrosinase family protein [Chitinophagaceae bacterium]
MKKIFFLSGTALVCFIIITSFINKRSLHTGNLPKLVNKKIVCSVPSSLAIPAALFISPPSSPAVVMIRKNIYNLSAAEITSLKNGITAMKGLPLTNPTSWQYQAAIHGTTLTNNLPNWNSCQHGTQFFFSWHRMYLYFFERILRAKSG